MSFPITLSYQISGIPASPQSSIVIYSGLTILVGPNGSGKTQVLRNIKSQLSKYSGSRKVRFLSTGRMFPLENYRSDFDGHRGNNIYHSEPTFGGKDSQQRRHNFETAQGDFHTLKARPDLEIKVAERLRRLFKRDLVIEWDAGNLKVSFSRLDIDSNLYWSAREASGLLQLVVLLTALYDDEVGALLIDEPEVSLHPQLQAFMLNEIREVAGDPIIPGKKIIIIATHSTEMIDLRHPEDLSNIIFCNDTNENPKQIAPGIEEFQNKKIRSLLTRLSHEHKLAFFCSKPILVEGTSDAIVCTGLDHRLGLYLNAAGAQILPVNGKGQMPVLVKLMRLIGKSPIVIADADSIADSLDLVNAYSNQPWFDKEAQEMGYPDVNAFTRTVYSDFCQLIETNWDDIAPLALQHPYWINRDTQKDEIISKRRAALSVLLTWEENKLKTLSNGSNWIAIRLRIITLLNFLEKAGCFILRKGAIESYYQFSDPLISIGKPSAAIDEVDGFFQKEEGFHERFYGDLLRALRYAATTQKINEARAVRELLLAIAASALGNLSKGISDNELNLLARRLLGEKASMLQLNVVSDPDGKSELVINLTSSVLNVKGFPVRLIPGCNPITEIDRQIGF